LGEIVGRSRVVGADNLTPWTFQANIMNGVDARRGCKGA